MNNNLHVYPENDLQEHNTEGSICSCNPKVEPQNNGILIIIHNAWDCRDITERAYDLTKGVGRN